MSLGLCLAGTILCGSLLASSAPFKNDRAQRAQVEFHSAGKAAERQIQNARDEFVRRLQSAAEVETRAGRLDEANRLKSTAEAFAAKSPAERLEKLLIGSKWAFKQKYGEGTIDFESKQLVRWHQGNRSISGKWIAVDGDTVFMTIVDSWAIGFDPELTAGQLFMNATANGAVKRLD